jgi:hypothetical protein
MAEAKSRRRKVTRKVRRGEGPREEPKAEAPRSGASVVDGPTDWSELADRAAKKVREFADKAKPAAEKMAVDVSEGLTERGRSPTRRAISWPRASIRACASTGLQKAEDAGGSARRRGTRGAATSAVISKP